MRGSAPAGAERGGEHAGFARRAKGREGTDAGSPLFLGGLGVLFVEVGVRVYVGEGDDGEGVALVKGVAVHGALEHLCLGGVGERDEHEALGLAGLVGGHLDLLWADADAGLLCGRLCEGLEESVALVGSDDGSAIEDDDRVEGRDVLGVEPVSGEWISLRALCPRGSCGEEGGRARGRERGKVAGAGAARGGAGGGGRGRGTDCCSRSE